MFPPFNLFGGPTPLDNRYSNKTHWIIFIILALIIAIFSILESFSISHGQVVISGGSVMIGGNGPLNWTLTSAVSAGGTTLPMSASPAITLVGSGYLVIDPFTTNCETIKAASVSSSTVTLNSALVYPHSSGTVVFLFDGNGFVPITWFGAKGDNSTDDYVAMQRAFTCSTANGFVIDGLNRTHLTSAPLLLANGGSIRHMVIKAKTTFAPAETNNAILLSQQGFTLSFTASASTDFITTSAAHSLPSEGVKVVFQSQGSNFPSGLTEGRVYYCTNRTASTFQVASVLGGAIVDITADGGGKAFCEVVSLEKVYLNDIYINGNSVVGINGADVALQQPAEWLKVRIDNCAGFGLRLKGQQAHFSNFESVNCGTGLILDNASFMYFYTTDIEQFQTNAIYVTPGSATSCSFYNSHFEGSAYPTNVFINMTNGPHNMIFDSVSMSGFNTAGDAWIGFDMGASNSVYASYIIRNVRFPGGTPSATNAIAVRDNARKSSIFVWADVSGASANGELKELIAPQFPSSFVYTEENGGTTIWGASGRQIRWGMQRDGTPSMAFTPGSAQTGAQLKFQDQTSGDAFQVTKDGFLTVGTNGTAIKGIIAASATLDFPSTSSGAVADLPITVTGAAAGDVVKVGVPQGSATSIVGFFSGFASNNTVYVRFIPTAASQDPASGTFKVVVTKF